MRQTGMIDADLSRDEALDQLGLAKFSQPVLVAGPMAFRGVDISGWPYAGVPPELIAEAQATSKHPSKAAARLAFVWSEGFAVRFWCPLPAEIIDRQGDCDGIELVGIEILTSILK